MDNRKGAYFFVIGFFCFLINSVYCQDQRIADSLSIIYQQDKLKGSDKLELLRNLSFNEINDLNLSLKYANELIELASSQSDYLYMHRGYYQKGNKKRLLGDLEEALEAYFTSIDHAKSAEYSKGVRNAYVTIADVYSVMGNSNNAKLYYHQAIDMLRIAKDSISLATALLNAGDEYFNTGQYDSALRYFDESGRIFRLNDYLIGTAYNLGNSGMVYAEQGKDESAEKNINEAIAILEEVEDYYPICVYLTYISDIYWNKGDGNQALDYARRSLELAEIYGLKEQISDANLKLSELYEQMNRPSLSLRYYKAYIAFRDSVRNIETVQQMADLRTDFEVSQKQIEVDLLNQTRKSQRIINAAATISAILILALAGGLLHRYNYVKKTKQIIEHERDRSDQLLLNILPEETATELKSAGKVEARKFESVTVLFSDFKGFTKIAEKVDADLLVRSIDYYFKAFDEICTKYGLEKIKTIGDAYMCADGIPKISKTHATNMIRAAIEMISVVNNVLPSENGIIRFEARIGIHTGPVVAGVVGLKKWQYDIWGDTVNIAARMEANSQAGKINLSETTYQYIKDEFACEYRGELEAKNKGKLKMYFLTANGQS